MPSRQVFGSPGFCDALGTHVEQAQRRPGVRSSIDCETFACGSRAGSPRPTWRRSLSADRRVVEFDADELRDSVEIRVAAQQGGALTPRDGSNHAVDHPPRGDP